MTVGTEVAFRLGRGDAEHTSRLLARVDPKTVRQDRSREESESAGMAEQWEQHVQALQDLPPRHAYVRAPGAPAIRLRAQPVPDPTVAEQQLADVEAHYLATYFRPLAEIDHALAQQRGCTTPSRTSRLQLLPEE